MTKIYKGAVGLELRLDVGQSIGSATSLKIKVEKPDGSKVEWVAAQYNSTTLNYVTVAGDLSQSGKYVLQSYVEWGETSKHLGQSVSLTVFEQFE